MEFKSSDSFTMYISSKFIFNRWGQIYLNLGCLFSVNPFNYIILLLSYEYK